MLASKLGLLSPGATRACGVGGGGAGGGVGSGARGLRQCALGRSRVPCRLVSSSSSGGGRRYTTMAAKIDLYSLATPNGQKIGVALEEMELEYTPHTINIMKNEQFTPEYIAINPNSKIPAIIDPNGPDGKPITVFESGAILLYLAEKSGKFLSPDPRLRWETIEWVFFQMAGIGPMFGQLGHFYRFAKEKCKDPYPVERYSNETKRLLGVLEKKLEGHQFLIGNDYSIADIATFPWVRGLSNFDKAEELLGLSNFPNVMAWAERCFERPASARGTKVCSINN